MHGERGSIECGGKKSARSCIENQSIAGQV